ncbi:hypothetical protein [Gottfriedia acidiceleris]|uniref:hypothetical protein n=1 Tax=Gottfriedia acidiceleris TaxID=371036 RepID=UPI00101DFA4F|nr:hypothetical protein [Gottfriedia acidiceleris]
MFSLNIASNEKVFADLLNGAIGGSAKVYGGKGGKITVTEESLQPLKQMIAEANTEVRWNDKVQKILSEETPSYFEGQKSAETVEDIIQYRVMTYLNE